VFALVLTAHQMMINISDIPTYKNLLAFVVLGLIIIEVHPI
jgi:hypothetical protein